MKIGGRPRSGGFSLIEVMVALIVCSIGLLGLAKMESLALASEDVAGTRTIAALEAASMAAMMHADRGYWASSAVTTSAVLTWVGGANPVNVSDASLQSAGTACTTAGATACSVKAMAIYDLWQWGTALYSLLPGYTATITCVPTPVTGPVTCTITINWVERAVAMDNNQTSLSSLATPSYTLNVQP